MTTQTAVTVCARPSCGRPATRLGWCEPDYRRQIRMGRAGYRDATPARDHVQRLRALSWTYEQIQTACGVSARQARAIERGEYRRVRSDTLQRLLSVPLTPATSHRGVPHIGTTRRLQALQWMGWPTVEIAHRVGSTSGTLLTVKYRGGLSARLAQRIADVYEQLSHVPGPSKVAAAKARASGYVPPLSWDEGTLDDPAAKPLGVR